MPCPQSSTQRAEYPHLLDHQLGTALVCPYCGGLLTAKNDQRIANHFAHAGESCLVATGRDFNYLDVPIDPNAHLASLISQELFDRVNAYVERGMTEGLQLVTGGKRLTDRYPASGYYYESTTFTVVKPEMTFAL